MTDPTSTMVSNKMINKSEMYQINDKQVGNVPDKW